MATLDDLRLALVAAVRDHGSREAAAKAHGMHPIAFGRLLAGKVAQRPRLGTWRAFGLTPDAELASDTTARIARTVAAWQAAGTPLHSASIAVAAGCGRTTVRRYLESAGLKDQAATARAAPKVVTPKVRWPRVGHPWADDVRRELKSRRGWWLRGTAS